MIGTNCYLFTHNQSRSYLNHLVPCTSNPTGITSKLISNLFLCVNLYASNNAMYILCQLANFKAFQPSISNDATLFWPFSLVPPVFLLAGTTSQEHLALFLQTADVSLDFHLRMLIRSKEAAGNHLYQSSLSLVSASQCIRKTARAFAKMYFHPGVGRRYVLFLQPPYSVQITHFSINP